MLEIPNLANRMAGYFAREVADFQVIYLANSDIAPMLPS